MTHHEHTPDQFKILLDWPVQWGDQDLFGHVNNAVYFRWFESARVNYLDRLGLARVHGKEPLGPILASIGCNFRRQIQFPDTVQIGTRVARIGRTSITIEHAIWSTTQGGIHAADGSSVVVVFDYRSQQPTPVPDDVRALIEKLEGRKF